MDKTVVFPVEHWRNLSLENIGYTDPTDGIKKEEAWLPVVGYEGFYEVSCLGRVKSLDRIAKTKRHSNGFRVHGKIKPSFYCEKGYRRVEISKESVNKKYFVHRLVAIAFIPNPENKNDINHKRGIVWDNRVSEIEWSTESENAQHSYDVLGRKPSPNWLKGASPEKHPMFGKKGKLSPNWGKRGELCSQFGKKYGKCKTSIPIICNETNERYESITQASDMLNIGEGIISEILKGFDKKANGLTFRYESHTRKRSLKAKGVICLNNGQEYQSISDAALSLKVQPSKISLVLSGKKTHTKGYKFKAVE